ncbi:hypothetical protein OXPF_34800 [Oxobacter pfennigii]|uniref:Quinate 5-dehydrogenase n=1 Tax=Oxobacter pfennigii TaxID=36849 RepID=A0A0N8NSQ9_9CLOT|nr:hypothetical protein [Oxobacter pfennigii]KPU42720.1 hypothetical protein OXPF_34800 [Oxobacter pfennigii]
MKRVVSVSLGSSARDHRVIANIMNEEFEIERIGTNGSMEKAIKLIEQLDGKVAAFGMGGIDLYLNSGNKRYIIKDAKPINAAAKISPILDGSFVKNTLERKVIKYIRDKGIVDFKNKNVLLVCGLDRFGMAEAITQEGALLTFGDLIFSIGLDYPIHSIKALQLIAGILAPIICRMPFEMIYPTGEKQHEKNYKYTKYFHENEIIAGDFLYIKRYMPDDMKDKIVITNTVTAKDIEELNKSGVKLLITTTPELDGRSFGTNVIEAVLTAISGKKPGDIKEEEFDNLIDMAGFIPRVEHFGKYEEQAFK